MPTLNIFVSFEFDKDQDLKNNFLRQAKEQTNHRIRDHSLHEAYPDEAWKIKARNAIRQCDVVVLLIGQDTQNAPGVIVETDIARSLHKGNCSDLRGSADYSAYCGRATEHGISTANRFRPLKREQLRTRL